MNAAELMNQAAEWRLIALLFERPREDWANEVRALVPEVADHALRGAAAGWLSEASEGDFLALLGPGGAASPREVGYRGMGDPGWILADIAQFHQVFGYRSAGEDPPDHVAAEAAFVSYLWLKEAFARENDDAEAASITAVAREEFLVEHLAHLAAPLAKRLTEAGGTALAHAAQLLAARVPPPPVPYAYHSSDDRDDFCGRCAADDES